MNLEYISKWFTNNGFVISEERTTLGTKMLEAEKTFGECDSKIVVAVGENGNARVIKPNGTVKWYYEKTFGQLTAAINKTMDYYK